MWILQLSPSSYTVRNGTEGNFEFASYGISVAWSIAYPQNATNCNIAIRDSSYACAPTADCFKNHDISGYNCNCTKGYSGDGYKAGIGCVDIDECALKLDDCDPPPKGRCINTDGSYTCSCVIDDGSKGSVNYGKLDTCPSNNNSKFPLWLVLIGIQSLALHHVTYCQFLASFCNERH
ncbi:hypothetical protein KP509_29G031900 [Ceratopteris richardii]|uniref:EGF-like calcium-binding domain-containing protein n=1 Tax=Ceratopteris richardii TaxID=49495 RepID=A0A8T2R718_CERRI|nr:hypothetical protein KP509_29G031900 [Ceratopteris richardii]